MNTWRNALQSLHFAFVLSVALPLIALCGFLTYTGLGMLQAQYESELQGEVALVARAARYPLARLVEKGERSEVDAVLESIFAFGHVYGASIYDVAGVRIARIGVADSDVTRNWPAADVVASGDSIGTYRVVRGEEVYSYFTPLFASNGRINGLLQVTRDHSEVKEQLQRMARNAWWLWAVMSLVILLVAVIGHYGAVGRHVQRLLTAMERVSAGELQAHVKSHGPRELRSVAQGFNRMLTNIRVARDEIGERQQRELALERRLQQQEKSAMIGRVAGGVAHELGAPLSVIQGRSRILQRAGLDDAGRHQLREIDAQVERMTGIIRQLLDCFRHTPDRREETDLCKLLESVLQRYSGEPGATVTLRLPDVRGQCRLSADPLRLELAVDNLVRNARQFARAAVRVSLDADESCLYLSVEDDGPGIPSDRRDAVFEPFYTTQPAGEGTGLGLAVVQSVVMEHAGQCRLQDSELGGCHFTLVLPRRQGAAEEAV